MGFSKGQASDDKPTADTVWTELVDGAIAKSVARLDETRNEAAKCLVELIDAVKNNEWHFYEEVRERNAQALKFHAQQYVSLQVEYTKAILNHDELIAVRDGLNEESKGKK